MEEMANIHFLLGRSFVCIVNNLRHLLPISNKNYLELVYRCYLFANILIYKVNNF